MTDTNKYIEELLNRFLEGECSTEEENELYAFFKSNKVPEHLAKYKPAFDYFEDGLTEELEGCFTEATLPVIEVSTKKRQLYLLKIAAAALAVLLSIPLFIERSEPTTAYMIKNGVISYNTDEIKLEQKNIEQLIAQEENEINEIIREAEKGHLEIMQIEDNIRKIEEQHLHQ